MRRWQSEVMRVRARALTFAKGALCGHNRKRRRGRERLVAGE